MPPIKIEVGGIQVEVAGFAPEQVIVMQTIAKMTAVEVLGNVGIDPLQREEVRKDLAFLRSARTGLNDLGRKGVVAGLTSMVGGLLAATWYGLKHFIS